MPLPRRLSAVLLAAVLLLAAAASLTAAPAAASGPGSRGEGLHSPSISCAGDTVSVSAIVRGRRDVGPVVLVLWARSTGGWRSTGRSVTTPVPKTGRNSWTLDASGLPRAVTSLRVDLRGAGATVSTPSLPRTRCAPGTEVQEVPVAALLPLTLVATAGAVLLRHSRRAGSATGAP